MVNISAVICHGRAFNGELKVDMFECSFCRFCSALKMSALHVHEAADERTLCCASPGYSLALLWSENRSTESQESYINYNLQGPSGDQSLPQP